MASPTPVVASARFARPSLEPSVTIDSVSGFNSTQYRFWYQSQIAFLSRGIPWIASSDGCPRDPLCLAIYRQYERRWLVRITHAEIDDVLTTRAGDLFELANNIEDVRRQSLNPLKVCIQNCSRLSGPRLNPTRGPQPNRLPVGNRESSCLS